MSEIKIKRQTFIEWQKHLNQWRREYDIKIHDSKIYADGTITLVIERTKKQFKTK